jgi:hypothetical protein
VVPVDDCTYSSVIKEWYWKQLWGMLVENCFN